MPSVVRLFGDATVMVSFITTGVGALVMCFAPGLLPRVAGLIIVGFGGAPLYPLTVDRLYASAEHKIDSISLGAICILASGTAVTLGPLAMGVLSDASWLAACPADRSRSVHRRRDHAATSPHSAEGSLRHWTERLGEIQSAGWGTPSH